MKTTGSKWFYCLLTNERPAILTNIKKIDYKRVLIQKKMLPLQF